MPLIQLETKIAAPREVVFDLARSIDAHQASTAQTHERAIAGVTTGLLGLNEDVTWEARHFGVQQRLSVRMVALDRPSYFRDVMIKGAFATMAHDHFFHEEDGHTRMEDRFAFTAPGGVIGRSVERLVLTAYMRRFLVQRNAVLKQIAESGEWRRFLPAAPLP